MKIVTTAIAALAAPLALFAVAAQGESGADAGQAANGVAPSHMAADAEFRAFFLIGLNHYPSNWVVHGEEVSTTVLLSGCVAGSDGQWRVEAEFEVTGPSGEVYMPSSVQSVSRDPDGKYETPFKVGLVVPIRMDAAVGRYLVTARVRDTVAGRKVKVLQHFEVVASAHE